jgi:hypothetical protein
MYTTTNAPWKEEVLSFLDKACESGFRKSRTIGIKESISPDPRTDQMIHDDEMSKRTELLPLSVVKNRAFNFNGGLRSDCYFKTIVPNGLSFGTPGVQSRYDA